jgi:pimeloyl-ACP methyl ester carboxylesterase
MKLTQNCSPSFKNTNCDTSAVETDQKERIEKMIQTRSQVLKSLASVAGLSTAGFTEASVGAMSLPGTAIAATTGGYRESRVYRGGKSLYVREWKGAGAPFVMAHGFPDNLHIYDELAPRLAAAGRRVVTFDFMGFGGSDKPSEFAYSFVQQAQDYEAVVASLGVKEIIPVVHDSGGPAGIAFALNHPDRVSGLVLLNTFFAESPTVFLPEFIRLNTDPMMSALAGAFFQDPKQLGWLLTFQQQRFERDAPDSQKQIFATVTQPLINANFSQGAGVVRAFREMTADYNAAVAENTKRLIDARAFSKKVAVVWGSFDPYLNSNLARDFAGTFPNSSLTLLEGGHWVQIELPDAVASAMLAQTK